MQCDTSAAVDDDETDADKDGKDSLDMIQKRMGGENLLYRSCFQQVTMIILILRFARVLLGKRCVDIINIVNPG